MTRYGKSARVRAAIGWVGGAVLILLVSVWTMPAPARIAPPIKSGDIQGGDGTPYEDPELGTSHGDLGPMGQRPAPTPGGTTDPSGMPTTPAPSTHPAIQGTLSHWEVFLAWLTTMLRMR